MVQESRIAHFEASGGLAAGVPTCRGDETLGGIDAHGVDAELAHATAERALAGQVRAAHLRVLSRLLQHHIGESGIARLVSVFPQIALALSPTLAPLAWIDLQDLILLLEKARIKVPHQQVPQKVGRGTISATFARFFGADPTTLSAETVISALPTFWDRYHSWSQPTVLVETGAATVFIEGHPGSVDICNVVGAELERIVELTGAKPNAVQHPGCAVLGAGRCEFRLSWSA